MDKLKICRKDKLIMFILSCFLVLGTLWIYPECFKSVYELFFLSESRYLGERDLLDDLLIVILGIPGTILLCYPIKQYICILLDMKTQKLETVKVKGRKRPEAEVFDTYVPGTKSKNDIYFYWKAIDDSKKRYRFLVFKDVNTLRGETTRHHYNVTYYKYSKIVTHIEKARKVKITTANASISSDKS